MNAILSVIFFVLISNCTLNQSLIKSGVTNLHNKQRNIQVGLSNKNDIINYLGPPLLKEFPNEDIWLYFETIKKRNLSGSKTLIKNDGLILEFDQKGKLINKNILNAKDMNLVEFDTDFTKSVSLKESFSKKFFSSMRKRFINKQKEMQNTN